MQTKELAYDNTSAWPGRYIYIVRMVNRASSTLSVQTSVLHQIHKTRAFRGRQKKKKIANIIPMLLSEPEGGWVSPSAPAQRRIRVWSSSSQDPSGSWGERRCVLGSSMKFHLWPYWQVYSIEGREVGLLGSGLGNRSSFSPQDTWSTVSDSQAQV